MLLLTCHHHSFINTTKICNLSLSAIIPLRSPLHLNTRIINLKPSTPHRFISLTTHADSLRSRSQVSSISNHVASDSSFDSFLSLLELSCLISSAVVSACVAVIACWKKELFAAIGNRAAPWGVLMLAIGVLTGALIRRRRQWRETVIGGFVSEMNLLQRIEKLEEDLKSSATVVRVLSRQLEKLGIRFRVTRKSLKEPIAETAALAQKNSEAARVLAAQLEILEKELGGIQQVLLAMQEQQQKQVDLILAIAKAGKLWESKRETSEEHIIIEKSNNSAADKLKREVHQI